MLDMDGLVGLVSTSLSDTSARLLRVEEEAQRAGDSQALIVIGAIQAYLSAAASGVERLAERWELEL